MYHIKIKQRLALGLAVLIPISVIIYILWFIIRKLILLLEQLARMLPAGLQIPIPVIYGISLLCVLLLVYLIGWTSSTYIGKLALRNIERLFSRAPLIGAIYRALTHISKALVVERRAFKEAVWVEFPRKGLKTLGFVTGKERKDDKTLYSIFIPTVPNPTSGFFVRAMEEQVEQSGLTVDEAFALILSAGMYEGGDESYH